MRIVYLTDGYGRVNCGTKHSLLAELRRRGHVVREESVHSGGRDVVSGPALLPAVREHRADWVFVAHSWVRFAGCSRDDLRAAGTRVLGFGFSDPYGWDPAKLSFFDAYATNHFATADALQASGRLPVTTFPTACDVQWHRDLGLQREGVLVYGTGIHPRFDPTDYRLRVVRRLLGAFPEKARVHGYSWGDVPSGGPLLGEGLRKAICRAAVVVDLQQPHAPLAHRMFEAMACGTPCVTRQRPEVARLCGDCPGLLTYEAEDDLVTTVGVLLADEQRRAALGREGVAHSATHHDIRHRVDGLLTWLGGA